MLQADTHRASGISYHAKREKRHKKGKSSVWYEGLLKLDIMSKIDYDSITKQRVAHNDDAQQAALAVDWLFELYM